MPDVNNFFQMTNANLDKKHQGKDINPLVYSDEDPELYVVSDVYSKKIAKVLKQYISNVVGRPVRIAYVYPYPFKAEGKEGTEGIEKFVFKYAIDFSKYIPEGSKILAVGRGLYALTKSSEIFPSAFYDTNFNRQQFYHPETKSWVFPVDHFYSFYSNDGTLKDNWEHFFFRYQLNNLLTYEIPAIRVPSLNVEIVDNPNEFLSKYIGVACEVACDLETTGLNFWDDIICFTCSFDGRTGYYLPWNKIDVSVLSQFFLHKYVIGANLKFDCKFMRYHGVENVHIDFDTLNAGHCLNEMRSNTLGSHGWLYTYYGGHEQELTKYKHDHPIIANRYALIPKSILSKYATMDSIICYQVYKAQKEHLLEDELLNEYYYKFVVPTLNMFIDIELAGITLDWDKLKVLADESAVKIEEVKQKIFDLVGHSFNLASPVELSNVLEHEVGFPSLGVSETGGYLTGIDQLQEWEKQGFALATLLIEYRKYDMMLKTFLGDEDKGNAYWAYKKGENIYPNYMVMLAQSHRLKCKNPNLQQVPKRTDGAEVFRQIFVGPTDEYYLAEGDFSGFQLRIASVMSGDVNMVKVFSKRGGDLHSMTAKNIFHRDMTFEEFLEVKGQHPYKEQRQTGKKTNFQFLFGGSPFAFANDVIRKEWTEEACETFLKDNKIKPSNDIFLDVAKYIYDQFFESYAGLKRFLEMSHVNARKNGYARSVHGARRLLPQLQYIGKDDDTKFIKNLLNISINSVVQNFEVSCVMRTMVNIHRRFKENNLKSFLFGMIHDAVDIYVHKDELKIVYKILKEEFERDYPEYRGVIMECEFDLANPRDKENPTTWGFGKYWEEEIA